MKVVETVAELKKLRSEWTHPVGFVPTMGYLHPGHKSLVERARNECATVVASIFVNPAQFAPSEDLDRYPRDLPRDLAMCEAADVDVVFTPTATEVYPEGFRSYIEVAELGGRWEGASRPGHFRGVATVVAILFRMVAPDRAYFGEKDYQQLQIVRRMTDDLRLDVEVIGCPTIREPDGLACSSRNVYLAPAERTRAGVLHRALSAAQGALDRGERRADVLGEAMRRVILETPGVELDYAAVVDPSSLVPVEQVGEAARALIAVRISGVHLIDNAPLIPPRPEAGQGVG